MKVLVAAVVWTCLAVCGCKGEAAGPPERVELAAVDLQSGAVDLLFVVDNSGSMSQEQAVLARSMPSLLEALFSPEDRNGDGRADYAPVHDLNVGVVSTDMGAGGFRVSTCSEPTDGDAGCLLHAPPASEPTCDPSFPPFLERDRDNAEAYPVAELARDFGCIATLGTQGCGFEQQLFAARDAVTTNARAGGCNAGFLRERATLVIVFVTDENDCSVPPENEEMFDPSRADLGHLNIRCFLHPELIEPVEAIRDALRAAKPGMRDAIVLGMIVGVPPDVASCAGSGSSMEGCLADAAMLGAIDPTDPTSMIPSCNTAMGQAFPPRRLVELAAEFGDAAVVGSICREDWSDVMAGLAVRTAERLSASSCLSGNAEFNPVTSAVDAVEDCQAECLAVETLPDGGPCREDAGCPSAWCPPATLADALAGRAGHCTDPAWGLACEPLERDLGLDEAGKRRCLLRQARRSWGTPGGDCSFLGEEGWIYVPAVWSEQDPQCPEAWFPAVDGWPQLEEGAAVRLYCVPEDCPTDKQCGGADDRASLCCFPSQTCLGGGLGGQGSCCPTERVCEGMCCELSDRCLPSFDSPGVRGCCPSEAQCGDTCCAFGQTCERGWMCV